MKKRTTIAASAGAGVLIGIVLTVIFLGTTGDDSEQGKGEPLYWVAPMDDSYRRDEPGKSPMGMDLVPVYEEDKSAESSPGTVHISPDVVNNFGVRTAKAEYAHLQTTIKTVGYVQFDEDRLVHIHPRVEGWIERLFVTASGNPVEKGQPLYTLYSPELVNAQEELILAVNRGNQRLIQAAQDRLQALNLSREFIEDLKQNKQVQQTITFFAKQNGVVDNLNIREGFYVKPGTPLMSIGTLDEVWVEAEVFERQASQVKAGLPVTMTLDYLPGQQWRGEVDYVYPTLDEKTRTVGVRMRFDNEERLLKPNMFAQVIIHAESQKDVLRVPQEAVIRTGEQDRVVMALGDGRFKSVAVRLGRMDNRFAEILSGLRAGDEVVTSAQFLIDSESSKRSDFKRIHHEGEKDAEPVWTSGVINQLWPEQRRINITHDAISEWSRPAMRMDFTIDDSVDMALFEEGKQIDFTFVSRNDDFVIQKVESSSSEPDRQDSSQEMETMSNGAEEE